MSSLGIVPLSRTVPVSSLVPSASPVGFIVVERKRAVACAPATGASPGVVWIVTSRANGVPNVRFSPPTTRRRTRSPRCCSASQSAMTSSSVFCGSLAASTGPPPKRPAAGERRLTVVSLAPATGGSISRSRRPERTASTIVRCWRSIRVWIAAIPAPAWSRSPYEVRRVARISPLT
ncbi:MAG: hypothetical protein B7Z68_13375 [Acidobacteria bacterium 21-70-11]|nr:MAG: hypothetical protein B7Z68_13375 [Acidobacteria bacterium 21-70-11]